VPRGAGLGQQWYDDEQMDAASPSLSHEKVYAVLQNPEGMIAPLLLSMNLPLSDDDLDNRDNLCSGTGSLIIGALLNHTMSS